MKKNFMKLAAVFIVMVNLFCGCQPNNKNVASNYNSKVQQEQPSQYGENDKPWGDYNYKKVGVLKNL
ncbi:MAG: hypothetical protein PUE01_02125 [Clostridiaceae bacterium]|nr:hypothetical protein [Clostridiaceae bacterium]